MAFNKVWKMSCFEDGCYVYANQNSQRVIVRYFATAFESREYFDILNQTEEEEEDTEEKPCEDLIK